MMEEIKWPNNKRFAFTIVDDTDASTVENIKRVYDFLYSKNIFTTKTVWCCPSRDKYNGECLSDESYKEFIIDLSKKGYEIAFHGAGAGEFQREEIVKALNMFRNVVGYYPKMHINHGENRDCIYWGEKRFLFPVNKAYKIIRKLQGKKSVVCYGDDKKSPSYWGDYSKKHIKYIRNRVFSDLNTKLYDNLMPYIEKRKEECANYWFSSSDGYDCNTFNKILSKKNVDILAEQSGYSIVYTHFAYGFCINGELNKEFKQVINYLSEQDGWFVPASELLNHILKFRKNESYISPNQSLAMDFNWLWDRCVKGFYNKIFKGR